MKRQCETCGKRFNVNPAKVKAGKGRYCSLDCYMRARYGRPGKITTGQDFWARVDQSGGPNACWPWMGYRTPRGYGRLYCGSRTPVYAHRVACALAHGPIPPGMDACHKCDNPPCCNPAHLFPGTQDDNIQDAKRKGRLHGPRKRA